MFVPGVTTHFQDIVQRKVQCSIEGFGTRTVALWIAHGWGIVILEVEVGRLRAVVVSVAGIAGSTSGINLGGGVISPRCVVSLGTVVVPGEGRVFEDPRIFDHLAAALVWVVHAPRAITRSAPYIELGREEALLDKVGGTDVGLLGNQFLMVVSSGDIVDHTVDFVGRHGVDIRQQPVTRDISLDSPS